MTKGSQKSHRQSSVAYRNHAKQLLQQIDEAEVDGEHIQVERRAGHLVAEAIVEGEAGLDSEAIGDEEGVTGIGFDAKRSAIVRAFGHLTCCLIIVSGRKVAECEIGTGIEALDDIVTSTDEDVERAEAGTLITGGLVAETSHDTEIVNNRVTT